MKKMRQLIFLLFAFLLLPLSLQLGEQKVSAAESQQVTFILHKLLFENGAMPEAVQNDGTTAPAALLKNTTGLNDATFSIYDVSDEFYKLREAGRSVEEAQRALAQQSEVGTFISEQVTASSEGEAGIAKFTVSARDGQNRDAVYRFVETNAPSQVNQKAAPLVVVLPIYSADKQLSAVHLYPKNEQIVYKTPSLEKTIDRKQKNFGYGETIPFTITTKIPADVATYDSYTISDNAAEQLWLAKDSVVIRIDDKTSTDFQKTMTDHGFTLTALPESLAKFANKRLTITYQMELKGTDNETAFDNEATLIPGNHPKVQIHTKAETGGKQFVKVDRKTNEELKNAQFVIRQKNKYLAQINGENHWVVKDDPQVTILNSDEKGKFAINGLAYGSYELIEIKAPAGYRLNESPIPFTVENGSYDFQVPVPLQVVNEPISSKTPSEPNTPGTPTKPGVSNKSGITKYLPKTGEEMIRSFSIIGLVLLLIVGTVWHYKKRQNYGGKTK
ncbi:SpaH/EbpB family LPXTG-anchored major pilin [Enterococcus dongliensis]|uniref:SpaH/EbpB family LPXTG-anchored major pilin n=1 Tax=Enterococcus dongliensis TaxID=2559925 RepID=UPI00288CCADA|nr:SpaH/EbpB family LPXTG-anchored major pilin [Enterococcus dongliensis]MDT2614049.1 SpaH/EbpB family LPXTG-anchored major pilin [Enterococcus dongliensis]